MMNPRRPGLRARPLARRLILWTIFFSGALAFVITVAQLLFEYRRDVGIVEERFQVIEHGYLASIVDSVWAADRDHLGTLLQGVIDLPDFSFAEVTVDGKRFVARGNQDADEGMMRTWPLVRPYRGQELTIGQLTIKASLALARERFIERAVFIVAANVVKTILVAFFMLMLVDRLMTRHLEKIADSLARASPYRFATPLSLDRQARDDELQHVVTAINRLHADLDVHHAEMARLNNELEQRVIERTAELESANKELESFSFSVSHDLQAPLRSMMGYSQILLEDERERLSPAGREQLDRIVRAAQRMKTLIGDILLYSRAGRAPIEEREVHLDVLARDVLAQFAADYPRARVAIGNLPPAVGDAAMLRQVMQNLIGNALKYSAKREQPEVRVDSRIEDGRVVYFVADNGAGFDMRYADKLFGMFQRLHAESEFPGTGVGLAIVRRLIERHGGSIWATAEPDHGATFYFRLGGREIGHESDALRAAA